MQSAVTTSAADQARLILTGADAATRRAMLILTLEQFVGVDDDADLGLQDVIDTLRADLDREVSALLEECRDERLIEWTLATSEGMSLAETWRQERIKAENEAARQRVRARVMRAFA